MTGGLAERIARLEAAEAIRNQIATYAYAGDRKNDPTIFATLFTEDAAWSCEGFGSFEGRDAILAGLSEVAQRQVLWSLHFAVAPMVTLAEDMTFAQAFWWLWELSTLRSEAGDASSFMGGNYRATLINADGRWLFKKVDLSFETITPFRDGWVLNKK